MEKEKLRLNGDHMQPSKAKLGPQKGRLIPCKGKPNVHPHHPDNETCGYCEECPPSYESCDSGMDFYLYSCRNTPAGVTLKSKDWSTLPQEEKQWWRQMADQIIDNKRRFGYMYPEWYKGDRK